MRTVLLALLAAFASGQDLPRMETLRREVSAALKAKDYGTAAEKQRQVAEALPHSSAQRYRLAEIEALAGHREEALRALDRYARMGGGLDPAADDSFATLKADGEFTSHRAQTLRNRLLIRTSEKLLDLPAQDLITEDIAWDSAHKRFLVSSVHRRKVISVGLDGKASEFIGPLDAALGGVFALGLDAKRDRLWASTASMEQVEGFTKDLAGHSSLLCFQLSDLKLLERVDAPSDGKTHALGDMTVAPDGEVFVSDGRGSLFRHRFGEKLLNEIAPGQFRSPQTPALAKDGRHLFVADYSLGIARVDLSDQSLFWLGAPDDLATEGIDGLYRREGDLLAVQNGTVPARVLRLELSPDQGRILRWTALDAGELPEPTHGAFVDGAFCYLSGAGWERFNDDGSPSKDAPADAPSIRRIPAASLERWPSPSTSRPRSVSPAPPSR